MRMYALLFLASLAALVVACAPSQPSPGWSSAGVDYVPTVPPTSAKQDTCVEDILEPGTVAEMGTGQLPCSIYEIGEYPAAMAWSEDGQSAHIAYLSGDLTRFDLREGSVTPLFSGLVMPQGVAVVNDRLYVSHLGNHCHVMGRYLQAHPETLGPYAWMGGCKLSKLHLPDAPLDLVLEMLTNVSAQVAAFPMLDNGELGSPRVIIDRIVVNGRDHSPNGMTTDGSDVFVSIGHPQEFVGEEHMYTRYRDDLESAGRRVELMGTVVRIRPDDSYEVYATGLRNVYGIDLSPDGRMFGGDNDEHNWQSFEGHREELNQIEEGAFYGYPYHGTNTAPPEAGVTEPVHVFDGHTSVTVVHAAADGLYVAATATNKPKDQRYVVELFDYDTWEHRRVMSAWDYITGLEERDGVLYVMLLSGHLLLVDADADAVQVRRRPTATPAP